jgi:hypothetical protein
MTWRRARATASVALGTLLLPVSGVICACTSPTLPVPPPITREELVLPYPSEVDLVDDGTRVRIAGDGAARTGDFEVVMRDVELDAGSFVAPDSYGHYEGTVAVDLSCARPTNHVELWQRRRVDGFESTVITITVPRGASPFADASVCIDAGQGDAVGESAPEGDAGTE